MVPLRDGAQVEARFGLSEEIILDALDGTTT